MLGGFLATAQSIEGTVVDEQRSFPLIGATITIADTEIGTVTDENGYFILQELGPGRYDIEVSYVGYGSRKLPNVLVASGKINKVRIELSSTVNELDLVEVTAGYSTISPGRRTISEEQINRFAASYYDPARLMTTSPDVSISNDQNNQVSIRGISPDYNTWRLEGVEIVNPNHLSNAGTPNDQPAGTSGGVNILSAQMLGPSSLEYGLASNSLSNSIGGIFDMSLKTGTSTDYQFTTQASLIGFDLSAEGPFQKGGKASFITNYRYSFTSLLTSMGVDFGGESIGFQDLAATAYFPLKKGGGLKVYGVGGTSFNRFDHLPFEDSEREKDRNDIYYESMMGVVGATFNSKGFNASVAYSGVDNDRRQTTYDDFDNISLDTLVNRDESVLSTHLNYQTIVNNTTFTFGVINNFYGFNEVQESLSQLYFETTANFSNLVINGGLTLSSNDLDTTVFDPRLRLQYIVNERLEIYGGAGRFSQLLRPSNFYFARLETEEPFVLLENYDFIFSNRYTLGFTYTIGNISLQTEGFYYQFSDINFLEFDKADSRGVSVAVQRDFNNLWYLLAGATFFDSQIGGEVNNPFNLGNVINLSGGKEFVKVKKDIPRSFTLNARMTWQGGAFYTVPFGTPGEDVRLASPFNSQIPDYLRFDLRLQWTKSKPNMTRIVALDMQNALLRENVAYYYFDSFLNREETANQLGLIPILTYRLEF